MPALRKTAERNQFAGAMQGFTSSLPRFSWHECKLLLGGRIVFAGLYCFSLLGAILANLILNSPFLDLKQRWHASCFARHKNFDAH